MTLLSRVTFWRSVSLALFALILVITFLQPAATDSDIRIQAPRIAFSAALFLAAIAVVPLLLSPVRIRRSQWMPWVTAGLPAILVAGAAFLNLAGRTGAAGSIFQALHVVTGERNFGDVQLPLVWRLCARQGVDVYSEIACVQENIASAPQHVMDYGPSWLWMPDVAIPPSWSTPIGLTMLVVTSGCLWWLSRNSLGRGQIALFIGSLGASWLLLLERGNLDALVVWFAVLFALWLRRSSGLGPWIFAAIAIWILGTWKYYPFALGLLLLPVMRRPRGWILLAGFVSTTAFYVTISLDRFIQALADNADRSALIGTGLGRDSIARLLAGSPDASTWAVGLVLVAALATVVWGYTTANNSRPVSFSYSAMAFTGASMVAVPMVVSGFGHQYKVALLVLAVPALSRLRNPTNQAVWQSSTFVLVASAVALVGLWGNPFAWSILIVVATSFALGASLRWIYLSSRSTSARDLEPMPRQHAAPSSD